MTELSEREIEALKEIAAQVALTFKSRGFGIEPVCSACFDALSQDAQTVTDAVLIATSKLDAAERLTAELTYALAQLVAVTGYDSREDAAWTRAKELLARLG